VKAHPELIIPREVPSQNVRDRLHWRDRHRDMKAWLVLVRMAANVAGIPAHGGKRRRVRIEAYRIRKCADRANLIGGCKGLIDAITTAGLIVDDSEKWAQFEYAQDLANYGPCDGRPCTVISIEDLPDQPKT
jgi:hypothetical protein